MDRFDQRLSNTILEHKIVQTWRKLISHCIIIIIIIMAIENACILHTTIKTKKLRTMKSIQQICANLVLSVDDYAVSDNPSYSKTAHLYRKHFPDRFFSLRGRRKPRGDELYTLIRRSTLQARLVGKTHLTSILVSKLVSRSNALQKNYSYCGVFTQTVAKQRLHKQISTEKLLSIRSAPRTLPRNAEVNTSLLCCIMQR
jgi:hypothetical protein